MEIRSSSRRSQLRMDEQDRVSQASSVATISYFPVMEGSDGKVQTFGKRCQAAKRDPNCPVVIRGWLNKKDSSGLKLWKRRWFVLSNYCLFYYKDSREESVLGSIPLPSYKILFCTPRECKNRKFTFKVVHQGMRSYYFSADTQEDMLGWVRALSQSATMEPDSTMNRRCSSYQDFTQIGGSSESVDGPKSPSEEESPSQRRKHVSRTLSEPSQLAGGRMGRSHSEQRGRRSVHHRNRSPSNRSPSPPDSSRRRAAGPIKEDDTLGGENATTEAEMMGMSSFSSRGQLGSRPHSPAGRVDIRPHDDPGVLPQTLYYAPASPRVEFKSAPTTPVTERWQSLSKPAPIYGSVHQPSSGRRPLGKSHSTRADFLPPLPPSSRATHALHPPQHHRSHLSVCVLPPAMASKPELRELPALRPLESDADAVLTRLCGCDKLLQSLSVELTQLQMDKDSVHCALEMSRLQMEEWKIQGPQAFEEALTQKVLLQEELVTIRARMCDVSVEMERVWSQYERMESELSVIRSHLQHICSFGMPQEQSQAQRELWMMEDILAGLKLNRDNFCFLLGLQRHHMFQSSVPHHGSPGSLTERLQSGLPMDMEQEPPVRPPLPTELQENHFSQDLSHGWPETPYEGIYCQADDPVDRRGNNQPDLLNVKAQRETAESQSGSKWIPPDRTNQPTKKIKTKMSEEEQIERMKRNQERIAHKKKPLSSAQGPQNQSSETREEAPFPLRVTRVVTAVLPSSLVARKVSVEDPPPELDAPLPEQIPPETQQQSPELCSKLLNRPTRRVFVESQDSSQSFAEQDQSGKKISREQHQGKSRVSRRESQSEGSRAEGTETSSTQDQDPTVSGRSENLGVRAEEQPSVPLTPDMNPDLSLSPEQRDAKLRRVERIRARVMRSAVRETTDNQHPLRARRKEVCQVPNNMVKKPRLKAGNESCLANRSSSAEHQPSVATSQECEENQHVSKLKSQVKLESRIQHSEQPGVANSKIKRPASPYHISPITVYHKDGGKGFTDPNHNEQKKLKDYAADDADNNLKSSHLRMQWFLSANQNTIQIPASEPTSDDEQVDTNNQAQCPDDLTDPTEFSSAVSESLKKMKENHSLFYKIACDISISDSDITKNDEQASRPEDEKELVIHESEPVRDVEMPSDQKTKDLNQHLIVNDKTPNLTNKMQKVLVDPVCDHKGVTPEESEDISEKILKDLNKAGDHIGHTPDEHSKTKEPCLKKKLENLKEEQEGPEELKNGASLRNETEKDEDNKLSMSPSNTTYESGGVVRSASFGKSRVTVIRTSL
ncbi:pleckstrin homology domain-containing family A member 6 [Nematolebias whitei]|uniref:pleckstrin homology domain-containing family A member 6 n=1 Tax=Nematolebias whitei TaxID=451745 RepID=UPI001898D3C3|nr:pleckstrin homology domain-containing family A member 6 [Nematolebias whitei]